jgi:hypothetical protein
LTFTFSTEKIMTFLNRRVTLAEVRNDTEANQNNYVRVLDPRAAEISFVRTGCQKREAFWLSCSHLECGRQSVIASEKNGNLPKMSQSGDCENLNTNME